MLARFRWSLAALALSLTLVLATPVPAGAVQTCEVLSTLGVCTPSESELQFNPDGSITLPGVGSSAPSTPPAPSSPTLLPDAAKHLLNLANQERARVGAPTLVFRDDVVQLATAHTRKMLGSNGGIFHNLNLLTKPLLNTLGALAVGENVGWSTHVEDLHPRLMASPAHRAALLDPRFTVAGFAVIHDTDGLYYVTQDFVQPSGATPRSSPPPPTPPSAPSDASTSTPPGPADEGPRNALAPEPSAEENAPEDPDPVGLSAEPEPAERGSVDRQGDAASELAQGGVAGLVFDPQASTRSPGRAAPVGLALVLLATVILGQGWWWARGLGRG